MKEIEVKILDVNRKALVKKLLDFGAKKIMDATFHALTFRNDNFNINKSNNVLRLRKEGDLITYTLKTNIKHDGVKSADEYEVTVSDFDEMKKIILALGFTVNTELFKRRISYKLDGVKFEFDNPLGEYEFVPEFLEIEASNKEEVYKYAKILGYSKEDLFPYGFGKVLKHYSK